MVQVEIYFERRAEWCAVNVLEEILPSTKKSLCREALATGIMRAVRFE
jgi:hypothetical protein